jgi:hypothetical protein
MQSVPKLKEKTAPDEKNPHRLVDITQFAVQPANESIFTLPFISQS